MKKLKEDDKKMRKRLVEIGKAERRKESERQKQRGKKETHRKPECEIKKKKSLEAKTQGEIIAQN